jgi:hypothetical protein
MLALRPASTLSGRMVAEADPSRPAPPDPPRFLQLESAEGNPAVGRPSSVATRSSGPGEFSIGGVPPGLFLLRTEDQNWMIKSAVIDGRDVTYTPIDMSAGLDVPNVVVTFTNAVPTIEGTVHDATGTVVPGAVVVIFPIEHEQWINCGIMPARIRTAQASSTGAFRLSKVPAGAYDIVALPPGQADAWAAPGFFERADRLATHLTVGWGERKRQDIALVELK